MTHTADNTDDPWAPVSIRWVCPCGRWIPEASITSEDYLDPGAYFGVSTTTTGTCSRCGVITEPRLITFPKPAPSSSVGGTTTSSEEQA